MLGAFDFLGGENMNFGYPIYRTCDKEISICKYFIYAGECIRGDEKCPWGNGPRDEKEEDEGEAKDEG